MPAVSVVLPVYNGAHLVSETIHTILAQDFQDFELLIVDDGSTDNTFEVIGCIADPRIRVIHLPENSGIGFARNRGVQEAKGDFIAFADADDHWVQGKLSKQVGALSQYPEITLLFSDFENIDQLTGVSGSGFAQTKAGLDVLRTRSLSETLLLIQDNAFAGLLMANFIATPTVIFRKKLVEQIGNLDPSLRQAPDEEFVLRCAVMNVPLAFHTEKLVFRYKARHSVTAYPDRFYGHVLDALAQVEVLCLGHGRGDLLPLIDRRRYSLYLNLIRLHARNGNRKQAWHAFWQSTAYGRVSLKAILYLTAAIGGPRIVHLGKTTRRRFAGMKATQ